jgi:NAD(P)H-flavin reductase
MWNRIFNKQPKEHKDLRGRCGEDWPCQNDTDALLWISGGTGRWRVFRGNLYLYYLLAYTVKIDTTT